MFLFGWGSASPRGCFVNLHCLYEVFSNKRLSTISSFPIQLLFSASSNFILDDHFTCFLSLKLYLTAFGEHVVWFLGTVTAGALVVITVQEVSTPRYNPTFCSAAHYSDASDSVLTFHSKKIYNTGLHAYALAVKSETVSKV